MSQNRLLSQPSESDHLLQNVNSGDRTRKQWLQTICLRCLPNHLCLPSKAAILIVLWTFIVGAMHFSALGVAVTIIMVYTSDLSEYNAMPFAILALIMIFYPLSGYVANTCCGRLNVILTSSCLLLVCLLLCCLGTVIFLTSGWNHISIMTNIEYLLGTSTGIVLSILAVVFLLLFTVSIVGYQANFIQLGLDQLFEARSHFLGLFVHYAVWTFYLGGIPAAIAFPLDICIKTSGGAMVMYYAIPMLLIVCLVALLCIGYWKYNQWFYTTPSHSSPYKTIYRILKFIRKHKYPLQRSAFTYDDEYIPSRLDFAKERFGGPFTTEQVENFKAFLRILLILFALGPVFVLEVPASHFVFPFFSLHTLHHHNFNYSQISCTSEDIWEMMFGSGAMITMLSTLFLFPAYIWINFSVLHNRLPKIFNRLRVGVAICLLGVASLLITDVVGHSILNKNDSTNHTQCMFQFHKTSGHRLSYPALNMHWAILLLPSLLLGVGPMLVITTTLEFISAQSPQSMKGFLIGIYFAIRGLFQVLNSIIIIPFSLKHP